MDGKTLVEIKGYLQSIKPLFVEGSIKLISEDGKIKISYKDSFLDFGIKERLPYGDKEAVNKVVCFCFDCYSDFEWKGDALNSEILGKLLKLKPTGVRTIISKIYKKLKVYGEPILSEKQTLTNIQDYQQRTRRSSVQKKSSTTIIRTKKGRAQKSLWES